MGRPFYLCTGKGSWIVQYRAGCGNASAQTDRILTELRGPRDDCFEAFPALPEKFLQQAALMYGAAAVPLFEGKIDKKVAQV
jgi:hypothetical protein